MITGLLKRFASRLPASIQQELKRRRFAGQIRRGRFDADEVEWQRLPDLVTPGDWVIDVGANIGHYTLRLARLVGPEGRVFAFEPVLQTFELLAANVARAGFRNVTLINAAASDEAGVVAIDVPSIAETGLQDFYSARISADTAGVPVFRMPVGAIPFPSPIRLVKIDAEGHEPAVLHGLEPILRRDRPHLIVEDSGPGFRPYLASLDYEMEKIPGSWNVMFHPVDREDAA
jgi:FkbM family methyltransferase